MRFSTTCVVAIFVTGSLITLSEGAGAATAPTSRPSDISIETIPYRLLIERAIAGVKADAPALQSRPNPLAPVAPELLAAWKELSDTQPQSPHYAVARRKYLDALEQFGDPSGTLPTFPDQSAKAQPSNLREAPKVAGMLDPITLLIQTSESQGQRLWAVKKDAATPILSKGQSIKLKPMEPGKTAPSGTVEYFDVLRADARCAALGLHLKEQLPRSGSLCLATLTSDGELQIVMVADERLPGLPDAWDFSRATDVQVNSKGLIAIVANSASEALRQRQRHFALVVTPAGEVKVIAGVVLMVANGKNATPPPPPPKGVARWAVSEPLEVMVGNQRIPLEGREQDINFHIVQWNADSTLLLSLETGTGKTSYWSYSPDNGTATSVKDLPDGPQLSFENRRPSQPRNDIPRGGNVQVLLAKTGDAQTTVAEFPLPPLDGFEADQLLDVTFPRSKDVSGDAIAGPNGQVAIKAFVGGQRNVRFNPGGADSLKHWPGETVVVEIRPAGAKPKLVAEASTVLPAPQNLGDHHIGTIIGLQYLPDGRLLFAGVDDRLGLNPVKRSVAGGVASLWIWDGNEVRPLVTEFTGVEAPSGSSRMLDTFTYDYVATGNLLLLKRAADDCAFIVRLAP